MVKCECGLNYVPGVPEDEKRHDKEHYEYLHGPYLPDLHAFAAIDSVREYPLVMVDATVQPSVRRRLSMVAYVAQRETPGYPAGYDGTISDGDERLFLATDGGHAIAMVLTALDEGYWLFSWTPGGTLELLDANPNLAPRQKIGRVWVAKAYRRCGVGSLMVRAVVAFLGYELPDIGWELPLTKDGTGILQRLVPSKWWGRGDGFALQRTLEAER